MANQPGERRSRPAFSLLRCLWQRSEQVHHIAIRVEERGVALAPKGISRFRLARIPGGHNAAVHLIHFGGCLAGKRQRHPVTQGRLPIRMERLHQLQIIKHESKAVAKGGLDVRALPFGGRRHPEQTVEVQGASHIGDHDSDRIEVGHARF